MISVVSGRSVNILRAPNWRQHKYSTGEWKSKLWYIHAMKYYSVRKRNRQLMDIETWVTPKYVMLGQRSQTQNSHTVEFHLHNTLQWLKL